jgi:esterase/lipase
MMDAIQEMSWRSILQIHIPILTVLAQKDRIVDNNKIQQFLAPILANGKKNKLVTFDSGHAIQFEIPKIVAGEIYRFMKEIE